jgi:hypothetical protein
MAPPAGGVAQGQADGPFSCGPLLRLAVRRLKLPLPIGSDGDEEQQQQEWLSAARDLGPALAAAQCQDLSLELEGGAMVAQALPALLQPGVRVVLSSLQLWQVALGDKDSLACLSQGAFPALHTLTLHSCNPLSARHLASVAAMAAPRLRRLTLSGKKHTWPNTHLAGMTAICTLRPQPVDEQGRPVPLVVACSLFSEDVLQQLQGALEGAGLSGRVHLPRW